MRLPWEESKKFINKGPTFKLIRRFKYVKRCDELAGYYDFDGSSNFKNARIQAGCAGHAGAVIKLPSAQAPSSPGVGSSQVAPACNNSGFTAG